MHGDVIRWALDYNIDVFIASKDGFSFYKRENLPAIGAFSDGELICGLVQGYPSFILKLAENEIDFYNRKIITGNKKSLQDLVIPKAPLIKGKRQGGFFLRITPNISWSSAQVLIIAHWLL